MARNKSEVFFCPNYTAVVRRAPVDRPARSTAEAAKTLPADPWSDHAVFLTAKQQKVIDWVQATFNPIIASRIKDFLVTGNVRAIAPLTDNEILLLNEKLRSVNEHGAIKADRLRKLRG